MDDHILPLSVAISDYIIPLSMAISDYIIPLSAAISDYIIPLSVAPSSMNYIQSSSVTKCNQSQTTGEYTRITRYIFHKFLECETALENQFLQFYNLSLCPQYSILPRQPVFFKIKDISRDVYQIWTKIRKAQVYKEIQFISRISSTIQT